MRKALPLSAVALFLVLGLAAAYLAITNTAYSQSDPCVEAISSDGTYTDSLDSSCTSASNRRGNFAKYYTFNLGSQSTVTATIETTRFDPYIYLMRGAAKNGTVVDENDDHDGSREVSQVSQRLAAGDYTIEVTAYGVGESGEYSLTVSGIPAGVQPVPTPTPGPTNTPSPTPTAIPGATATPVPTNTPAPTATPTPPPLQG